MFRVRSVDTKDIDDLLRLSKQAVFLNLPSDRTALTKLVTRSQASFKEKDRELDRLRFMLVIEDLEKKKVIGTCSIIAKHGTPTEPHTFFHVLEKKKVSKSLHIGFLHQVLRLGFDYDGPTEIGGLVILPEYRGHKEKLGKLLSLSRFMYMAARPTNFEDNVLAELIPPLNDRGESAIWEEIGRKFTNLRYDEADKLSRKNKEFFGALFPEGDIYTCMLAPEARESIGKVGPSTQPVKTMLEKIGFEYKDMIDPFDGGPHFWAKTSKIKPVKNTKSMKVELDKSKMKSSTKKSGILMSLDKKQIFCTQGKFQIKGKTVFVDKNTQELLNIKKSSEVYFL